MTWYLLIPFAFLVLSFLIRMPIGWGMFAGCAMYFVAKGTSLTIVLNTAGFGIYNAYILIAIPLFVFTANIMNTGMVTEKIFGFANSVVGRLPGGTAHVNILASLIFAGMTGSALADASGLGILEIEQMKKEGYDHPFSCAITAATSVIGPIFPPSIPFVVFAMLSGASVGKMFMGGITPALLLCAGLGVYVAIISKRRNYPRGVQYSFREFWASLFHALPALMTPVILLIGIYTGIMTPTEASAIAALYTMIVAAAVYRTLSPKHFRKILIDTIVTTGSIFLIVAAAYSFSYIVSVEQVDKTLAAVMTSLHLGKVSFLLVVNIVFIVLGCFLDVNVIQLVFVPIFIPIAKTLGFDMVHFGVMLCLNMMMGLATPPFGMLLFIVSGIGKCSMQKVVKEILPMLAIIVCVLLLISFVPQTVMWLPNLMK